MGIIGIVVMWVIAAVVFAIVSNDRYGNDIKKRQPHWDKFYK